MGFNRSDAVGSGDIVDQKFNFNADWLSTISFYNKVFCSLRVQNDYENLVDVLELMVSLSTPELKPEEIEMYFANIDYLKKHYTDIYIVKNGERVGFYPDKKIDIEKKIREMHVSILMMLKEKGMLKQVEQRPEDAIKNAFIRG